MREVLFARIDEDFALVEEMLALLPAGSEGWRPAWPGDPPFTVTELAAHLADSFGGACACFARLLNLRQVETAGLSVGESRVCTCFLRDGGSDLRLRGSRRSRPRLVQRSSGLE